MQNTMTCYVLSLLLGTSYCERKNHAAKIGRHVDVYQYVGTCTACTYSRLSGEMRPL